MTAVPPHPRASNARLHSTPFTFVCARFSRQGVFSLWSQEPLPTPSCISQQSLTSRSNKCKHKSSFFGGGVGFRAAGVKLHLISATSQRWAICVCCGPIACGVSRLWFGLHIFCCAAPHCHFMICADAKKIPHLQLQPDEPDISIVFKLHEECGKMINIYDMFKVSTTIILGD